MALAARNCVHTANCLRNKLTESMVLKYLFRKMCIILLCRLVVSNVESLIYGKRRVGMPVESKVPRIEMRKVLRWLGARHSRALARITSMIS